MTIKTVTFTLNGTTTNLEYDSTSGTYKGTITAPTDTSGANNSGKGPGVGANASGKGYYPASVSVTDTAGNVTTVDSSDATFGNILKLKVTEKTAPTVTITNPGGSARITSSKPTISVKAVDGGSGVKAVYVKLDSGTATEASSSISGDTATATYTPASALSEGQHTVSAYAIDYDGNQSSEVSVSFYIDTIAPTLNQPTPVNGTITNQKTITVSGTTNDSTSSPVTVTIKVGSTSYSPTVGTDGSYSQTVTLSEGSNTITTTATDAAGLTTSVTATVTLDTSAPVISEITLAPNPVDSGKSYVVTVKVTDA